MLSNLCAIFSASTTPASKQTTAVALVGGRALRQPSHTPWATRFLALMVFVGMAFGGASFAQTARFAGVVSTLGSGYSIPKGVAVDGAGNVFVADTFNNAVKETIAGTGGAAAGTVNANSTVTTVGSGFSEPYDVAVDGAGNVFVADTGNNAIKEIVAGTGGATAGTVTASSTVNTLGHGFIAPAGVAVDGASNVFVADTNSRAVKEIVAGTGGAAARTVNASSTVNTLGSGFSAPWGVAVDSAGNVFVADEGLSAVEEIVAGTGGATAGTVNASSTVNTLGSGFGYPRSVAVDRAGNVYVADTDNSAVKELVAGTGGAAAGTVNASSTVNTLGSGFSYPQSVAVDGSGNVFVADTANNAVKEIGLTATSFGPVAIGISNPPTVTFNFSFTANVILGGNAILTQGAMNLDFTDAGSGSCKSRFSFAAGTSCTVVVSFSPRHAGQRFGAVALTDNTGVVIATAHMDGTGIGPEVSFPTNTSTISLGSGFNRARGIAVDGAGNVFVADNGNGSVKEIVAGTGGAAAGTVNASSTVNTVGSRFSNPYGVAVDGAGNVFVADVSNNSVKEIVAGTGGAAAGTVNASSTVNYLGYFNFPEDVAVDRAGNVFVADSDYNSLKEIVAGTGGAAAGTVNASSTVQFVGSGFSNMFGVAVDAAGNVFVADSGNNAVKEIVAGTGSAAAGTVNVSSIVNTLGSGFKFPEGVAVDDAGNVFVADDGNGSVKEIVAGTGGAAAGTVNASSTVNTLGSGFTRPTAVAVDGAGNVFMADFSNTVAKEIPLATPPSLTFGSQSDGTTSVAQSVTVQNIGNATLNAVSPGLSVAANFTQVGGSGTITDCASSFTLASGGLCNLSIEFNPIAPTNGTVSGSVVLTDNNLNAVPSTSQTIQLSGTAVEALTLSPGSLPAATFGLPYSATFSATGGSGSYTYAVTAGALPAGLTLGSTGLVSGTATTTGSFSFTVTATDTSSNGSGMQAYTLTVLAASQSIVFAQPASPVTVNGTATLVATTVSGGPVMFSVVSGSASITGSTITYTNSGTIVIAADSAATPNYFAAPTVFYSVVVVPAPTAYVAPTTPVASTSTVQTAIVNIPTGGTLGSVSVVTQGVTGLDFNSVAGGTCAAGSSYTAGQACTVQYSFAPARPGTRLGAINLFDSNGNLLGSSLISGDGTGPLAVQYPGTQTTIASGLGDPFEIASDAAGNLYLGNAGTGQINKFAVSNGVYSIVNTISGIGFPGQISVDGAGNLYIASYYGGAIYKETYNPATAAYTQSVAVSGFSTLGVGADPAGNLFVVNNGNLVKETLTGSGYTESFIAGGYGFVTDVLVDATGNLYVADVSNSTITKLVLNADGTYTQSLLANTPYNTNGLAVDAAGTLYASSTSVSSVLRYVPQADGTYTQIASVGSGFSRFNGIAVDGNGSIFVADDGSENIFKIDVSTTPQLNAGTAAVGSTQFASSVPLLNIGNTPLNVTGFNIADPDFTISNSTCTSGPLAVGGTCTMNVNFAPKTAGPIQGTLQFVDNSLNVAGATQSVVFNGTATPGTKTITFAQPATPVTALSTGTLTASTSNGDPVTFSIVSGTAAISGSTITYTTAGSVTIAANSAATGTYNAAAQVLQTVFVNQITQAIVFTQPASPVVYGVAPIALVATGGGSGNAVTFSVLSGPGTISGSTLSITGAGSIVVAANQLGSANYSAAPQVTRTIIVNQAPLTASVVGNPTKTYDSTTTATLTAANFKLAGLVGTDSFNVTQTSGQYVAASAGSEQVTVALTPVSFVAASGSLANYALPTIATGSGTINKAIASVTPNSATKTYGTTDPGFSGVLSGFVPADSVAAAYTRTVGETVGASPYSISAVLAPTAVLSNYIVTYNTAAFTITQATASVTPNPATKIYGTVDPGFSGTLTGFLPTDGVTAAYSRTSGETVAGTYSIAATLAPSSVLANYAITYRTAAFTISKATASVTPNAASKVYGAADPGFSGTLSGFLPADGITPTYSSTAGETVAGSPYTISATLSPIPVLANYAITYNVAPFTITKAVLTVAANNFTAPYGTTPVLTAVTTGFVRGDTSSVVSGLPALTTTATSTSLPGSYPILVGLGTLSAANYNFNLVAAVDTVNFTARVPGPGEHAVCNGAYDGIYDGNLRVSAGQVCIFINGGVEGGVRQNGGLFELIHSKVDGDVRVEDGGQILVTEGSSIEGDLRIHEIPVETFTNMVCGSTIHGDLEYSRNGAAALIGEGAASSCPGNIIQGELEIRGNTASVTAIGNTVTEDVTVDENRAAVTVDNNIAKENMEVDRNTNVTSVVGNSVGRNLEVENNTTATTVSDNTVKGRLDVDGNTNPVQSPGPAPRKNDNDQGDNDQRHN